MFLFFEVVSAISSDLWNLLLGDCLMLGMSLVNRYLLIFFYRSYTLLAPLVDTKDFWTFFNVPKNSSLLSFTWDWGLTRDQNRASTNGPRMVSFLVLYAIQCKNKEKSWYFLIKTIPKFTLKKSAKSMKNLVQNHTKSFLKFYSTAPTYVPTHNTFKKIKLIFTFHKKI